MAATAASGFTINTHLDILFTCNQNYSRLRRLQSCLSCHRVVVTTNRHRTAANRPSRHSIDRKSSSIVCWNFSTKRHAAGKSNRAEKGSGLRASTAKIVKYKWSSKLMIHAPSTADTHLLLDCGSHSPEPHDLYYNDHYSRLTDHCLPAWLTDCPWRITTKPISIAVRLMSSSIIIKYVITRNYQRPMNVDES